LAFTVEEVALTDVSFALNPTPSFLFSPRAEIEISLFDFESVVKALITFKNTLLIQFSTVSRHFGDVKNEFDLDYKKRKGTQNFIDLLFKISGENLQDFRWKKVPNTLKFNARPQLTINWPEWEFYLANFQSALAEIKNF
jgi:hypothetical protein